MNGADRSKRESLKSRAVPAKPAKTQIAGAFLHNVFVLKFQEGTHIRVHKDAFVFDESALADQEHVLFDRAGLAVDTVKHEVAFVNELFSHDPELMFQPMFTRGEAVLDKEKRDGEDESGEELADLNHYFYVMVKRIAFAESEKIIDSLNALSVVEIAYPQPIPFPPAMDIPPVTRDFTLLQSYLEPAPEGIDAFYAWTFPGGRGDEAQLIDVEVGWHLTHEDLPPESRLIHNHGWNLAIFTDHGTAVLGVVAGQDNAYGVTGIVPNVALGVDSPVAFIPPYDVPGAINRAAAAMRRGGILVVEQHYPFGPSGSPVPYSGSWVPCENEQGDFDAIRNATARGIVVVEAAGNGGQDLDAPFYQGRFSRAVRDSGAIIVGAGSPYLGATESFSNFGRRVDVQGWGSGVMTLGYGNMVVGAGDDARQRYTPTFGGTSAATPIVAGAAAALQSIRLSHALPPLTSVQLRDLLRDTGTEAAAEPRNIGPLPNLRRAIDSFNLPSSRPSWPAFTDFQTDGSPVVVQDHVGAMACFVLRGHQLWWRRQEDPFREWSGWSRLGDQLLRGGLAVVVHADGRFAVFGRRSDRMVCHIAQLFPGAGSAWTPWSCIPNGVLAGDPVVVRNAEGRIEVFGRGIDDQLWTIGEPFATTPWRRVGVGAGGAMGPLARRPSVLVQGSRLTVCGTMKGRAIRVMTRDPGGTWLPSTDTGGRAAEAPVLLENAARRREIFVRGSDAALWHQWERNDGTWSAWTSLGGTLARHATPAVARSPFGNLMAFVRWSDNSLWYAQQNSESPNDWSPWGTRGPGEPPRDLNSDPVVSFYEDGRYDLFARARNGTLRNTQHRL